MEEKVRLFRKFITCNKLLIFILIATTLLKLHNLGHQSIARYDEICHAIVARNFTKHFFKPTLFDQPYLPYNFRSWGADHIYGNIIFLPNIFKGNHIWLHKPPYALWQIAISYFIFGVNTFALRFPSLILSGLAVFLTYLIGTELYSKKVGLLAAFLQAINPFLLELVHGYMFSDHVDVALIFWVELSCYLLIKGIKSGKTKYYILCGVAMGFGYLTKSYLCLIAFGIAAALLFLAKTNVVSSYKENISVKKVIACMLSSILVVAPWVTLCIIRYRKVFLFENQMVFAHLNTSIERWQHPWDHHLFAYMPSQYPYWYAIIFVSFFFLLAFTIKKRELSDAYLLLWIIGVVMPLSIAKSKVPAGTSIAMPALLLCFSSVFFRLIQSKRSIAVIAYFSLVFSLFFASLWPLHLFLSMKAPMLAYVSPAIKRIMPTLTANPDFLFQLLCFFLTFAIFFLGYIALRRLSARGVMVKTKPSASTSQFQYITPLKITTVLMLAAFTFPLLIKSVKITSRGAGSDNFLSLGRQIKEHLPKKSVFFLESGFQYDYLRLMFHADRGVYQLASNYSPEVAFFPKDKSFLNWTDYVFEGDFMVDDATAVPSHAVPSLRRPSARIFAFNYRCVDYDNFYQFNPYRGNIPIAAWHEKVNGVWCPKPTVEVPHDSKNKVWYRAQVILKGSHQIVKVKEASDPTPFDDIKPLIELDDEDHPHGTISLFSYGYVDDIIVYKWDRNGKSVLFSDDFEKEEIGKMPRKWEFFGGARGALWVYDPRGSETMRPEAFGKGDAKVVKDPKNKSNKVFFILVFRTFQKGLSMVELQH